MIDWALIPSGIPSESLSGVNFSKEWNTFQRIFLQLYYAFCKLHSWVFVIEAHLNGSKSVRVWHRDPICELRFVSCQVSDENKKKQTEQNLNIMLQRAVWFWSPGRKSLVQLWASCCSVKFARISTLLVQIKQVNYVMKNLQGNIFWTEKRSKRSLPDWSRHR